MSDLLFKILKILLLIANSYLHAPYKSSSGREVVKIVNCCSTYNQVTSDHAEILFVFPHLIRPLSIHFRDFSDSLVQTQ